jgi:hypothetical protein
MSVPLINSMHSRFYYWPVSMLPIVIVFVLTIIFLRANSFFEYSVFIPIAGYFIYFNYPMIYWSFRRKISKQAIQEDIPRGLYEFLRPKNFVSDHRVYSILTPVYVATLLILIVAYFMVRSTLAVSPADPLHGFLNAAMAVAFSIVYTSGLRFFLTRNKGYPYFLANAHLVLSKEATNDVIQVSSFINGLEAYNVFLQRNLKIKIKNIQSFYSTLASDGLKEQHMIMNNVGQAFHEEGNIYQLEPLRKIKKSMETAYKEDLLTGSGIKRNLQDWLSLLGVAIAAISALIGIVQLLFPK